jgi:ABC-type oligopeptide transport system ATPase subunit
MERVGLRPEYAHRYPHAFSGGERQRIGIARALATRPRLVILDEAVSALDVSVQAQILNLLIDLRESVGVSYLFVSHDLAVVRQVSDTIIVMRDGVVVEAGLTSDVLDHPVGAYAKQLLAAIPRPAWER